jgi:hypothetical protein
MRPCPHSSFRMLIVRDVCEHSRKAERSFMVVLSTLLVLPSQSTQKKHRSSRHSHHRLLAPCAHTEANRGRQRPRGGTAGCTVYSHKISFTIPPQSHTLSMASIPVANNTGTILLYCRSRRLLDAESASRNRRSGPRRRGIVLHLAARSAGGGDSGKVSLNGGVRRVVDGLADCDVPAVDELELGHGVGVARRHVVDILLLLLLLLLGGGRAGEGVVWL